LSIFLSLMSQRIIELVHRNHLISRVNFTKLSAAKVADVQSLAKNLPCSLTSFCQTTVLNFAKQLCWMLPNNCAEFCQIISPFTKYVCRLPNAGKCFSSCLVEKAASICWWNRPQPSIHQHFTLAFFIQKCFAKFFSTYMQLEKSCQKDFCTKKANVKRWWNWNLEYLSSSEFEKLLKTIIICTCDTWATVVWFSRTDCFCCCRCCRCCCCCCEISEDIKSHFKTPNMETGWVYYHNLIYRRDLSQDFKTNSIIYYKSLSYTCYFLNWKWTYTQYDNAQNKNNYLYKFSSIYHI